MKYEWLKYQTWFFRGLVIYVVACLVNSVLVIKYRLYGGEDCGFAIGFPFIAFLGVVVTFWIICSVYFYGRGMFLGVDSKYIKENYPDIWMRVVPFWAGGKAWTTLPYFAFRRGKYDNGTDERLNRIKREMKTNENLVGGAFFALILIELINLVLIGICRH